MGRLFVRAMLSQHGCVTVSVLALSGAPRQLSQRESLGRRQEPHGISKASPFGRAVTEGDGEGKPVAKRLLTQRWASAFVKAIGSLCKSFHSGILALSGASRQLSQRESLSTPSGSKKLPLSEELEVRFIRTGSFCHLQTHRRWRSGTLPAGRRPAGSSSPRRRRRR